MTQTATSGTRVIRNTVINSASGAINASLALVLTPFFLHQLGKEQYGVWLIALVFTLTQGFGLADLGLRQTGVRFIAGARGRNESHRINEAVSSLLLLFTTLSVAFGLLLAVLAPWLVGAFGVDDSLRHAATLTLLLVAAQLPIDMVASAFQAVTEGYERYGLVRIALVGARLLWAIGAIIVVLLDFGVVAIGIVSVGTAVLALAFSVGAARRSYPDLRPAIAHISRAMLRDLATFGASFTLLRVAGVVFRQMDKIIIASVLGAAIVADYDIPYKVHAIAALVLSLPASALMPAAANLRSQHDEARLKELYLRGTRMAVGFGTPVTIAALVFTEPIIRSWVGDEFTYLTGPTRVFMIYPLLVAFHNVASSMLLGIGRMRELVTLGVATTIVNLIISLVLVQKHGLLGVIWGTQIGYAIVWLPYLLISFRTFGVSVSSWWQQVLRPNLLGPVIQVVISGGVLALIGNAAPRLIVGMALLLSMGTGWVVFGFTGLPSAELDKLRSSLLKRT